MAIKFHDGISAGDDEEGYNPYDPVEEGGSTLPVDAQASDQNQSEESNSILKFPLKNVQVQQPQQQQSVPKKVLFNLRNQPRRVRATKRERDQRRRNLREKEVKDEVNVFKQFRMLQVAKIMRKSVENVGSPRMMMMTSGLNRFRQSRSVSGRGDLSVGQRSGHVASGQQENGIPKSMAIPLGNQPGSSLPLDSDDSDRTSSDSESEDFSTYDQNQPAQNVLPVSTQSNNPEPPSPPSSSDDDEGEEQRGGHLDSEKVEILRQIGRDLRRIADALDSEGAERRRQRDARGGGIVSSIIVRINVALTVALPAVALAGLVGLGWLRRG